MLNLPGMVEFQIFKYTNRIRRLTSHFELHRKNYLSQRGSRKFLEKTTEIVVLFVKERKNNFAATTQKIVFSKY